MKNILEKLNQSNNFHLTFKVIQIDDDNVIDILVNKLTTNVYVIKNSKDLYDKLLNAYNSNYKWIICNSSINILLPQVVVLTSDNIDIIKPNIPLYYHLKDNRKIQKIKTVCNKQNISYSAFKSIDLMLQQIIDKFFQ